MAFFLAPCYDENGDLREEGETYTCPDGCDRCKCMDGENNPADEVERECFYV